MRKKKETSAQILIKSLRSKRAGTIFLAIVTMLMFFLAKKVAFFILFVSITGIITYYTKLVHFPVDVSPLFFLEIVITRYYGFRIMLLFILIGYIIPKVVAGSAMNWMSYAFISVSIVANIASLFLGNFTIQQVGFITSVIQYVGGIFIGMIQKPFFLAAADGLANVTNNLLWFLIFSNIISAVLG